MKKQSFYDGFVIPKSTFAEGDKSLHRVRRKMLSNFFSEASIRSLQDIIYDTLDNLCTKMGEHADGKPMHLTNAFR